jgi:hypothetical protein
VNSKVFLINKRMGSVVDSQVFMIKRGGGGCNYICETVELIFSVCVHDSLITISLHN